MDIYQLIEEHKKGNYAFSVKYWQSKKYGKEFHQQVDNTIGHLYSYYGGKKFTEIFDDFLNTSKKYSEYSINDFITLYAECPKTFTNRYKTSSTSQIPKSREFADAIIAKLGSLLSYNKSIPFGKIFYDLCDDDLKLKLNIQISNQNPCKMCGKPSLFLNFKQGYSIYCCGKCTSKDAARVPEESKKVAIAKRNNTMAVNKQDSNWAKEYSKKISDGSKRFRKTEEGEIDRLRRSITMKEKIANGQFTPCITNSWNKWSAEVNGKKFRSRFEAIFYVFCIENNINIEYEKLRVPYLNPISKSMKNYIIDFVDNINKVAYEIKPTTLLEDNVVIEKEKAAMQWCKEHGYTFKFITEIDLKEISKHIIINRNLILPYLEVYKWS